MIKKEYIKTIKDQVCHGCAEISPEGSSMVYTKTDNDGITIDAYWCESCESDLSKWEHWQFSEDGN